MSIVSERNCSSKEWNAHSMQRIKKNHQCELKGSGTDASGRKGEKSTPIRLEDLTRKPERPSLDDLQPSQPPQPLESLLLAIREASPAI